jgi:pimeloyl-ACP methyl ester carboxylesterase
MAKKVIIGFIVFILLAGGAFIVWGSTPSAPMAEALAALESDQKVLVQADDWLVFQPSGKPPQVGMIYYPGGRVDYRAYAPYARAVAEQGFLVVIVPMPLNLAVIAPDRAAEVIAVFPEVEQWAVGGHSLGGAMAARYAFLNPQQVRGLVLVASYPADSNRLDGTDVQVLSLFGTQDGLATVEKIETSAQLLPQDTLYFPIEGGNHAQFGWYGEQ